MNNDMTSEHTLSSGPTGAVEKRGLSRRLFDYAINKMQKVGSPENDYVIERDIPVTMRDGATLLVDLCTPVGEVKGTLLARSPYGWPALYASMFAGVYATRGFRVVLARCRGTFGSEGDFEPFTREVEDGLDTVAWMREQPWFDGRFATVGGSYVGFTQLALFMDPPPELITAIISVAPHDMYRSLYPSGAFSLSDFLGWSFQVSRQEAGGLSRIATVRNTGKNVMKVADSVPVYAAAEEILRGGAPWFRDWVTQRDEAADLWKPSRVSDALQKIDVPILLQGGWQDIFLSQTLDQYRALRDRGVAVSLTVGPWEHEGYLIEGASIAIRESIDWLTEAFISGAPMNIRPEPVKVCVTGNSRRWLDLPSWPPESRTMTYYLAEDRVLSEEKPQSDAAASFTFDPANPTPTLGGAVLVGGGYRDDTGLANREDTLFFLTQPLAEDLRIMGAPSIQLDHSTDNPHADIFVRLSEVNSNGRSQNLCDGYVRLDADNTSGLLTIQFDEVAHTFAAGSRIRLVIAGACFPRFEINPGTGEYPAVSENFALSTRQIALGASRVILPVVGL